MRNGTAAALVAVAWATAFDAAAAGGHHAVDDAAILEPGQCQLEIWFDREAHGAFSAFHVGPACRIGPLEVGVNADRLRTDGEPTVVAFAPQLKWAYPLRDDLGAAIVLSATWRERPVSSFVGSTLLLPLTWQPSDTLLAHLNIGRDFRHAELDRNRGGAALEWMPSTAWSLVAERVRESGVDYWRAGARWTLSPSLSIDLSRARGLGDAAVVWWTLGLNWVIDRGGADAGGTAERHTRTYR